MSYNYWPRIYQWVPHGRKRSRRADHGDDKAEDIPMWRLGMNIYIDPNNIIIIIIIILIIIIIIIIIIININY